LALRIGLACSQSCRMRFPSSRYLKQSAANCLTGLAGLGARSQRCLFIFLILCAAPAQEWKYYGADAGGTRYSSLAQINKENVAHLKIAWVYDTGDYTDGTGASITRSSFEGTPLVVGNVMYVTTPFDRLIALTAETGERLWDFDPKIDREMRANLFINRGAAYWSKGKASTVYFGDMEGRLWAIDAHTGKPRPRFGNDGVIDLKKGLVEKYPKAQYRVTSPPAVCGDVVITGSLVSDSSPHGPSGDIFAFDLRTGRPRWRFHSVPRPGEFGNDTWQGESWKDRGGTNVWSAISVDETTNTAFLPLTSPSYDTYGGDRKGQNLFGDSLVAVDCGTGQRKWHFQTVHHDLWDYDLPAQPVLATVLHNGRPTPAVAQVTKTGFVFLFDRSNGEPLFEVKEQPVPKSEIPGEASWPTQPVPVLPPPFARQMMRQEDLTDVTPQSQKECGEMVRGADVNTSLFPSWSDKPKVLFPGLNGGTNWGSASLDAPAGILFVNSMDVGGLFQMVKRHEGSEIPYALRSSKYEFFWDKNGYPCQKPPWGNLTAIDLNTGAFKWRVVLGEFDELTARGIPKTGTPNIGGSVVTAGGLVFIGATNDSKFRAFDKDTGKELWTTTLPASGFATPMTFRGSKTGKQFVVIAAGGGNKYDKRYSGKLVAFALP
jgi:quinoprotein glucose dehydrogenase